MDKPKHMNADGTVRDCTDGEIVQMGLDATFGTVIPEIISQRQFMQQLAIGGDITWDEAKAYLGVGTIPAIFQNAINQLPPAQINAAEVAFIGADEFHRHNALTIMLGAILQKSDAQLDAIWTAAAAIQ